MQLYQLDCNVLHTDIVADASNEAIYLKPG